MFSSLYVRTGYELLITGFINGVPVVFNLRIARNQLHVSSIADLGFIGEGSIAANFLLQHRKYDPLNADVALACYCVYEAKKFSETVDSVGPKTWLKIHADGPITEGKEKAPTS